jgi:hypothetical protein
LLALLAWGVFAAEIASFALEPSPPKEKGPLRTDRYGDPLPAEAVARLGSLRHNIGHTDAVDTIHFSPDGRRLVSGAPYRDNVARIWNPLTGELTGQLRDLRAVEVLEHIGTPKARQVLRTLARGAPAARLTREAKASLQRIVKMRPAKP